MKQFIVLAAVLPFLMIFVMQFSLEQKNHQALSEVQEIVYNEAREARKTGRFSDESVDRMKTKIARALTAEYDDVIFECYMPNEYYTPSQYGDGSEEASLRLEYMVKAPIIKLIAGNRFIGISDETNRTWFEIKGEIPLPHYSGSELNGGDDEDSGDNENSVDNGERVDNGDGLGDGENEEN
jgi:hypothetical protein